MQISNIQSCVESDDSEESGSLGRPPFVARDLMLSCRPAPKRLNLYLTICSIRFSFWKRPAVIQVNKDHRIHESKPQLRGTMKLFIDAYSKQIG